MLISSQKPEGDKTLNQTSLYERLGGYDAVPAVVDNLLPRLQADAQLARFWLHRGEDGLRRERMVCAGKSSS
jgi:hemoglobin